MASGHPTSDRSALAVGILIGLLVLLPLLAWLQYRWIGQVSRAERERLADGLNQSADRFAFEFNSVILGVATELVVRPEPFAGEAAYIARYRQWRETSPYRDLIHGFFFTRDANTLFRVDPDRGETFPEPWPEELAPLRLQLRPGAPFGGPVSAGLAIAAPRGLAGGWVIAWLDGGYLKEELLPLLAATYLGEAYEVEVVSRRDPFEVIFQTDPGSRMERFDAVTGLFPEAVFGGRGPRLGFPMARGPGKGRGRDQPFAPAGELWELRVRHRSGSLDAVVLQTRRRNLAVSAGILLLLAGSVTMVVVLTRRAQRLARLQMEFVAGVSHELRTPLTVIRSAGDNLADGIVADKEQVRRYGAVIRDEGSRLTQMVEQILRFAGIQSGRARYDLRPVSVQAVVDAARKSCDAALRKSGCRIEEDLAGDLPPVVADSTALAHSLGNLLANAAKYASQGGWIGIKARLDAGMVEIRVEDRGQGIDAEDLPHLFDPFYRGRKAIADQLEGAGMGLSLVKRIVEAHNGSVEVSSRLGQGTVFRLRLPVSRQATDATTDPVH